MENNFYLYQSWGWVEGEFNIKCGRLAYHSLVWRAETYDFKTGFDWDTLIQADGGARTGGGEIERGFKILNTYI